MQEETEHKIDQQRKNHRKRNQNNLVPITQHVAQEKCNQYCGNDETNLFQDCPPNQQQNDTDYCADRADIVILLPNGDPFMLHLSAGVAWYPDDTTDRKEFTQYADFAMYQIKRTVKDKFGDFDKEAYRTSQEQYNKEKD